MYTIKFWIFFFTKRWLSGDTLEAYKPLSTLERVNRERLPRSGQGPGTIRERRHLDFLCNMKLSCQVPPTGHCGC